MADLKLTWIIHILRAEHACEIVFVRSLNGLPSNDRNPNQLTSCSKLLLSLSLAESKHKTKPLLYIKCPRPSDDHNYGNIYN